MIDHDAIAARVWQDRETGTPGPWHHETDDHKGIDYTDPRSGTYWNVAYVHSHCGYPIDGSSANARRIAALPDLEAAYLDLYDEAKRLRAERDRLRAALESIAKNTCCEGCQEAALVARQALKGLTND